MLGFAVKMFANGVIIAGHNAWLIKNGWHRFARNMS